MTAWIYHQGQDPGLSLGSSPIHGRQTLARCQSSKSKVTKQFCQRSTGSMRTQNWGPDLRHPGGLPGGGDTELCKMPPWPKGLEKMPNTCFLYNSFAPIQPMSFFSFSLGSILPFTLFWTQPLQFSFLPFACRSSSWPPPLGLC